MRIRQLDQINNSLWELAVSIDNVGEKKRSAQLQMGIREIGELLGFDRIWAEIF